MKESVACSGQVGRRDHSGHDKSIIHTLQHPPPMLPSRKWLSGVIMQGTVNSHTFNIPSNLVLWSAFSHIGKDSLCPKKATAVTWRFEICICQLISRFWTRSNVLQLKEDTNINVIFSELSIKSLLNNNKHDLSIDHQWCLALKLLSWKGIVPSFSSSKLCFWGKLHCVFTGWPENLHSF